MRRPSPRRAASESDHGQHVKAEVTNTAVDQRMTALLREATAQLHVSLHEHPLIVELLTRPSLDCYRTVLEAFIAFYEPAEITLIERSRRLGVAEQYPRRDRTIWLTADLEALGHGSQRIARESISDLAARLTGIGELAGCLYVIKGSALGGQRILRRLTGSLPVEGCCRFFNGDGENTTQMWRAFQRFCNQTCRDSDIRQAAIVSAKQTFVELAESLNWAMTGAREARPDFHSLGAGGFDGERPASRNCFTEGIKLFAYGDATRLRIGKGNRDRARR